MSKSSKNKPVIAQTNEVENVDATIEQPITEATETTTETTTVAPTVKTQAELIAEAVKYGINVLPGVELLPSETFNAFVRPTLTKQIADKIAEHLGEVYVKINACITGNNLVGMLSLANDNDINQLTLVRAESGEWSVKRTVRTITASGTGERKQRASKYVITDGINTYDSLSDMLHKLDSETIGKSINGAGVINKLKKLVDLNAFTVTNQEDNTSEPFAVWAKANIANCPTV